MRPIPRSKAMRTAAVAVLVGLLAAVGIAIAKPSPPAPPTITAKPANPTNSQTASFSYAESSSVGFSCALDGAAFASCGTGTAGSKSYSGPLAAGSHTFQVRSSVGSSTSSTSSYSWKIDLTAPVVATINRAGASPTNAASVSWTVTFSETVTG